MNLIAQLLASLFIANRAAFRAGTMSCDEWRAAQMSLWERALDEGVLTDVLEMVTR